MSISTLGTLFQFIGGLGMFLYGMESMADGLPWVVDENPQTVA